MQPFFFFFVNCFLKQLAGRHVPQNLAVPQHVEGTSENNASSNHSSECVASTHRKNECSEKGSDAQVCTFSSCSHSQKMLNNMYVVTCERSIVFS